MANSYLLGGAVAGMDVRVAGPYGYLPRPGHRGRRRSASRPRPAAPSWSPPMPRKLVKDADCVFTDTWVSMGEEAEYAIRSKPFWDYQVNTELMALAKPDAPSSSTACLPIAARRSPPRLSMALSPWFGMRRATVCTPRRRC